MKIVIEKETQKGFAPLVIILGVVVLVMAVFLIGKLNQPSPEKIATLSNSVPTATPQFTPTLNQLLAPSNLTASGVVNTNNIYDTLTLNWKDNSNNENGFALQRSTTSNFTDNILTISVPTNTTSFIDTRTVVRGQTYYYRVSSSSNKGNSDWSNTASIIAPFPLTPTVAVVPPPYRLEARLVCARADNTYSFGNHVDLVYQVTVNGNDIPFGTLTLTDNKTKDVFDLADGGHSGPPSNFTNISSATGYTFHWMLQDSNYKQMPFIADGREYTLKLYKLTTVSEMLPKDLQSVAETTFSKICEF